MKFPHLVAILVASLALSITASADDWRPVEPSLLQLKTPLVEKDADAEAIFWEVRVDDQNDGEPGSEFTNYLRIKIFTERGVESEGKVELAYLNGTSVKDIAARTIKPDGTIIELKKDAIFERTLVRAGGLKLKAKSFALPGVEPGAVIEYRWREVKPTQFYTRLQFQRDIPAQSIKYYIKPIQDSPYGMRSMTFHGQPTSFVKEKNGFYSTTMTNVPAFRREPRMPPDDEVRTWMLIYYSAERDPSPDKFWKAHGKTIYEAYKSATNPNDEVKQATAKIAGDATEPEQKLRKIFEFCRDEIKHTDDDASGLSLAERNKLKENKSPADTLKRKMGTGADVDLLFAAMARAAGFEARVATLADRSDIFFDPSFPDDYFLGSYNIAVKVGDAWRFYDPANMYVPFGMLRWQEEGQRALVSDPKEPFFAETPLSGSDKTAQKRTAKLRLSEDGTLEGDVRVEYTGHLAVERKEYNDDDSPAQREQTLLDSVKAQISNAELSDIKIENVTDPVKPFVYTYHLRVPDYAQRTGKRLFVQPALFQRGTGALFPTGTRQHAIYFHYPWADIDHVEITCPEGYTLDHAEAPGSFSLGPTGSYAVQLGIAKDNRTLVYNRVFKFNQILFPADNYQQLKRVFDVLYEQDNHTITLKQGGAVTATN
jgi:hypothetical protein